MVGPKVAQSKRIWWEPVNVPDLVGYKVYWAPAPTEFAFSLPNVKAVGPNVTEVLIPGNVIPIEAFQEDVDYNIWITSVDDVGNESVPLSLAGQFDFTPPPAPAAGGVESIY